MNETEIRNVIDIWKTVVNVQQHFNDISMRIRGMFVTLLLAFFAAMGFIIDRHLSFKFYCVEIDYAIIISVFGIFATWLFYFIDRYWYHRLLVGAVQHAISIEKKYHDALPELALSETIGKNSPIETSLLLRCLAYILVWDKKYYEDHRLHSDAKIEIFYKSVVLVLLFVIAILILGGGISI